MSYWIEHNKGKYLLGDFSGKHLRQLEQVSGPAVKAFLDKGEADAALVKRIVAELSAKKGLGEDERDLLKKLKTCTPPIALVDGVN